MIHKGLCGKLYPSFSYLRIPSLTEIFVSLFIVWGLPYPISPGERTLFSRPPRIGDTLVIGSRVTMITMTSFRPFVTMSPLSSSVFSPTRTYLEVRVHDTNFWLLVLIKTYGTLLLRFPSSFDSLKVLLSDWPPITSLGTWDRSLRTHNRGGDKFTVRVPPSHQYQVSFRVWSRDILCQNSLGIYKLLKQKEVSVTVS